MLDNRRTHKSIESGSVVAILLLALFFRIYGLDKVPPGFFGDEAYLALDAQSILQGNRFLIGPNEGTSGSLWLYLLAVTFSLFGVTIASARGLSVAVSIAGIVVAFFFTRFLFAPVLTRVQATLIATLVGLYDSVSGSRLTVADTQADSVTIKRRP
jgi:predicted membrane-bound mannosyltransferase